MCIGLGSNCVVRDLKLGTFGSHAYESAYGGATNVNNTISGNTFLHN